MGVQQARTAPYFINEIFWETHVNSAMRCDTVGLFLPCYVSSKNILQPISEKNIQLLVGLNHSYSKISLKYVPVDWKL